MINSERKDLGAMVDSVAPDSLYASELYIVNWETIARDCDWWCSWSVLNQCCCVKSEEEIKQMAAVKEKRL